MSKLDQNNTGPVNILKTVCQFIIKVFCYS